MSNTGRGSPVDLETPPRDEQASQIRDLDRLATFDSDFCLIERSWWDLWCSYSGFRPENQEPPAADDVVRPGPIDNSGLIDELAPPGALTKLRSGLKEGEHFKSVYSSTWSRLERWYGGGPEIRRPLTKDNASGASTLHIYPWKVKVHAKAEKLTLSASNKIVEVWPEETVETLKARALELWSVAKKEDVLWLGPSQSPFKDLESDGGLASTVAAAGISAVGEAVVLVYKAHSEELSKAQIAKADEDVPGPMHGPEPAPPATDLEVERSSQSALGSGPMSRFGQSPLAMVRSFPKEDAAILSPGAPRGMAGLRNLGNTCFMASSLQCLMHTVPLMRFFQSGSYTRDLNVSNPLGLHGELAEAFAALVGKLWQGGVSSVSPVAFRAKLTKFAPQFQGYAQQDGQELLAFLLDGLHEDLNRILDKPYVEDAESPGRSDEQMADEAWTNYRRRNDSVIVDHLQGLYKSTLVCPDCHNRSVKFDPFTYLTLQLPSSKSRQLTICLLAMDGSRPPTNYSIAIPNAGNCAHVYRALASVAGITAAKPEEVLLLAEVHNGAICEQFRDLKASAPEVVTPMGLQQQAQLLAYLYPDPESGPLASDRREVHVLHRDRPQQSVYRFSMRNLFAVPLVLFVPESDIGVKALNNSSAFSSSYLFAVRKDSGLARLARAALRPFQRPEYQETTSISAALDTAVGAEEGEAPSVKEAGGDRWDPWNRAAAAEADGGIGADEGMPPAQSPPGRFDAAWDSLGGPSSKPLRQRLLDDTMRDVDGSSTDDLPALVPGSHASMGMEGDRQPGTRASSTQGTGRASDASSIAPMDSCNNSPVVSPPGSPGAPMEDLPDAVPDPLGGPPGLEPGLGPPTAEAMASMKDGRSHGDEGPSSQGAGAVQEAHAASRGTGPAAAMQRPELLPAFDMFASQTAQPQSPEARAEPSSAAPAEAPPQRTRFTYDNVTFTSDPLAAQSPAEQPQQGSQGPKRVQEGNGGGLDMRLCSPVGELTSSIRPEVPELSDDKEPVCVAMIWAPPMEAAYNVEVLEHPQAHDSMQAAEARRREGPPKHALHECLEAFLHPEQLGMDDSWYCSRCKAHVQADKKLDLWKLPEILIIHLKRFSFSRWRRNKLDNDVTFPMSNLDLSKYVLQEQGVPPVYDLYAVSNHYGGLGGGHYTAFCQVEGQGWAHFNDSDASPESPGNVQSPAAYLLFYRRHAELAKDAPLASHAALFPKASKRAAEGDRGSTEANGVGNAAHANGQLREA
ncbi:hypothetical protein WJX73_007165 [Symbiochloris irregularis]|uniref:ubiquitinyl hydrolase 1 n=1 Tax=Symbiochloris irregularis TaxID=706552 RepID=A0AAW1NXB8_9CHLO